MNRKKRNDRNHIVYEIVNTENGKSPDYADAIMMRMYFELFPNYGSYSWA